MHSLALFLMNSQFFIAECRTFLMITGGGVKPLHDTRNMHANYLHRAKKLQFNSCKKFDA